MRNPKTLWYFLLLTVISIGIAMLVYRRILKPVEQTGSGGDSLIPYPILVTTTLPDFTLLDVEGNPQSTKQWRGKIIVLNFWATWCTPCRQEIPEFIALQNEFGTRGLQFVGIAIDDPAEVRDFAVKMGVNYPNLIGDSRSLQLSAQLGNRVQGLPFSVIVDRTGGVVYTAAGGLTGADIRTTITPLL